MGSKSNLSNKKEQIQNKPWQLEHLLPEVLGQKWTEKTQ